MFRPKYTVMRRLDYYFNDVITLCSSLEAAVAHNAVGRVEHITIRNATQMTLVCFRSICFYLLYQV